MWLIVVLVFVVCCFCVAFWFHLQKSDHGYSRELYLKGANNHNVCPAVECWKAVLNSLVDHSADAYRSPLVLYSEYQQVLLLELGGYNSCWRGRCKRQDVRHSAYPLYHEISRLLLFKKICAVLSFFEFAMLLSFKFAAIFCVCL